MAEIEIVLLVLDAAMLEHVVLAGRGLGADLPLSIDVAHGASASSVAQARSTHPRAALAVVASTDADAVEAIAAGADEALAFERAGVTEIKLLVERAIARTRHRLLHASAHGRAAHAEKLAALGTIVAGVAHEINNPLYSVILNLDAHRRDVGPMLDLIEKLQARANARRALMPGELSELVSKACDGTVMSDVRTGLVEMETQLGSVSELVRDLRVYTRVEENETAEVIAVPDLLDRVVRMVKPQVRLRGHIERDYEPGLPPLLLPRSRVVQVLTNILVNAAQAIAEVERPMHRVRVTARADADFVAVSISDTGPGIAPDVLDRIFDPFFTTKAPGKGTGLGLAISQSIMRELGGDLMVESVHGEGATFIALFPMATPEALEAATHDKLPERASAATVERPTVLVVEDDERLLRIYPRTLHESYEVIVASHGQEAIDLLVSGSNADAVLTDLAMPEVDGIHLYEWLRGHRPELAARTVFVTAGAHNASVRDFLEKITNVVLEKPVSRGQLLEALDRTLARDRP